MTESILEVVETFLQYSEEKLEVLAEKNHLLQVEMHQKKGNEAE